jgi:speckle-type POZ protein
MDSNDWKKLKEENMALLCDLQQMVFTAPTV